MQVPGWTRYLININLTVPWAVFNPFIVLYSFSSAPIPVHQEKIFPDAQSTYVKKMAQNKDRVWGRVSGDKKRNTQILG